MTPLTITPDVEAHPWDDLADRDVATGTLDRVGGAPNGTARGLPIVAVGIELPDGTVALGETTLALFLSAADALRARYGDPR